MIDLTMRASYLRIEAPSFRELCRELKRIDISVPLRGDHRKTEHTERWAICRFLAAYGDTSFIRYPLVVEKGERPDFRIVSRGTRIGIELTESVSEDFARLDTVRSREYDVAVVDTSLFRPGTRRRSMTELREILETPPMGPGWAGDSVEREWADVIFQSVIRKAKTASKPGFKLFSENWLLIYDNWSFPQLNLTKALEYLQRQLNGCWACLPFSHCFIERSDDFLHIAAPYTSTRRARRLWNES